MRESKMGRAELALISFAIIGSIPALAFAGETINYSYDAKGRLVKVERGGNVNNGVTSNYTHDKAGNRTNVTVTGSPNAPPP